ncbi:MAG: hypothetical protein GX941_08525, partial [Candidatus Methanofastidiosa archaeon]|nr:hypothetical protein [Candidatus Methanofastidiosa archaeon]
MKNRVAVLVILLILLTSGLVFSQDMEVDEYLEFENFIERGTVLEASEIMDGDNEF